ncbi:hypothetical protein FACS18947_0970 [Bacteroidia bacterium]|nr:hypothetical protein FACS18947_0970 [Bacteroidia bacterium]
MLEKLVYNKQPMPFYMAYPMPQMMHMEQEQERETQLMKTYYPQVAARIQECVERECDQMEYEGSRMYDEYPDKQMIEQLCEKIEQKLQRMPEAGNAVLPYGGGEELSAQYPSCSSENRMEMQQWRHDHFYRDDHRGWPDDRRGWKDDRREWKDDRREWKDDRRGWPDDRRDLVRILLLNEIFRRRCRNGRCKRYF